MNKTGVVAAIAALILSACGGTDSISAVAGTATSGEQPGATQSAGPIQGNTFLYSKTAQDTAERTSTSYQFVGYLKTVFPDGSVERTTTYAPFNYSGVTTRYDAQGGDLGYRSFAAGLADCSYAPALNRAEKGPAAIGRAWDSASTETCVRNGVTTVQKVATKGSITAAEQVTVPAGTFSAWKEVFAVTRMPDSGAAGDTVLTDYSCWHDAVSGYLLRCNSTTTVTSPGNSTAAVINANPATFELKAFSVKGDARSTTARAYYAGNWSVSFSGAYGGTCPAIVVGTDGKLSGTCSGPSSGSFELSGQVQPDGSASASGIIKQNNMSVSVAFTANLTPIAGSGSWNNASGNQTGTWTIQHK